MRLRTGVAIATAIGAIGALGAGSAFGFNLGQPPVLSGGPLDGPSVLVCHAKNLGGSGVVVFHDNGKVTGGGTIESCVPE